MIGRLTVVAVIGMALSGSASYSQTVPTRAASAPATRPGMARPGSGFSWGDLFRPRAVQVSTSVEELPGAQAALAPVEAAPIPPATLVSIKLEKAPITTALAELSKVSGYTLKPEYQGAFSQGRTQQPVTVSIDHQPFWTALREVCSKANITTGYGYSSERGITFRPAYQMGQDAMKAPATVTGPFMVSLVNLSRSNIIDMANPNSVGRTVQLQLHVFAEPKIKILRGGYEAMIEEGADENGNALASLSRRRQDWDNMMQQPQGVFWQSQVSFPYPTNNPGQRIVKLKGSVRAVAQGGTEMFEIPNPLTAKVTKSLPDTQIAFNGLTKLADGRYEADIVITRNPGARRPLWSGTPRLLLIDGKGGSHAISNTTVNTQDTRYSYKFTFGSSAEGPIGEAVKLTWELPSGTQNFVIPFEFTNLPMP